jgi:hypothetical protein
MRCGTNSGTGVFACEFLIGVLKRTGKMPAAL